MGAAAAAAAASAVATSFLPYLPSTFDNGHTLFSGGSSWLPGVIIVIDLVAAVLICRLRFRTPEQWWLGVAMVASLFDVWLTYLGTERSSIGWYLCKSGTVVTSLEVLLSLLHEITLLHLRAAVTNAILQGLAHQDGLTGLCNRRHLACLIQLDEASRCPEHWARFSAACFSSPIGTCFVGVGVGRSGRVRGGLAPLIMVRRIEGSGRDWQTALLQDGRPRRRSGPG